MTGTDRVLVLEPDLPAVVVETARCAHAHYDETKSLITAAWLVVSIAHGEGYYRGPGLEAVLRPGTLLSLPPGRRSFDLTAQHDVTVLAMREPAWTAEAAMPFAFEAVRTLAPLESRRWRQRFEDAAHEIATARFDDGRARALRDQLFELRWLPAASNGRQTVDEALSVLASAFHRPLRLGAVARELGYTPNYLNDLTRLHTGRSLGRWLADIRMSRARSLLARTDTPIGDVALACGFEDPAYFSRAFRRPHGVSPATWRIAHRPADARHDAVTCTLDVFRRADSRVAVSF